MRQKAAETELRAALARVLGVSEAEASFRADPDQHAIIRDIVDGRDVLAVMPTGGGKSACYQVPALCLPGVTLVVSPLVALIQDQGERLHRNGVPVACLAGGFLLDRDGPHLYSGEESTGLRARRDRIFSEAAKGGYKILYVTPERLRTGAFIRFAQNAEISLIAVDEAHCVSLWGYEFRPRYLEIGRLMRRMGYHPTVAAFTATATGPVRDDIKCFLAMRTPREYICPAVRDDLRFSVRRFTSKAGRLSFLTRFVRDHSGQSGIIYCATTSGVDEVYAHLKNAGADALRYYAKLDEGGGKVPLGPDESKKANLDRFRRGEAQVMVSTTALGMGIDKDGLRFVIHYELPLSLEDYFQEAGRAGRDGKGGECVLCFLPGDDRICRGLIERSLRGSALGPEAKAARRRAAEDRLRSVLEYCALDGGGGSLGGYLRKYFEDPVPPEREAEIRAIRRAMAERVREIDAVYANRTKVAGELRKGRTSGAGLSVGRARPGEPVPAVSYRLDGPALTWFDMMIADAVYTLMKNRVKTITAKGIMELLSGDPELTLRPERRAAVEESLRKMMGCRIEIDRRDSACYGFVYSGQGDRRILSGPFLPLDEKRSGFGYDPRTLPPIYEYAEILNGQFYVLPTERLRVPGLPASGENLAVAWYLLLRVGSMGRGPKGLRLRAATSRSVRMDTLLKTLDIRLPEGTYEKKRKLAALIEKERKVLEHLRTLGNIQGFTVDAERGNVSVEIAREQDEERT